MAKQQNSNPLNIVYTDLGLDKAGVSFEDFESKFNTDANVRRIVYNDLGLKKAGVEYETFESKLKKKDSSTGARSTSTSFANGGVTDLNSLASTTSTATPTPLTAKGVTPYQQGRQKQQRDLNVALGAFEEAQGVKAANVARNADIIKEQAKQSNKKGGVGDSFMAGLAGVNKGIYKIPRYVYELAAVPQNYIAEKLDMPELAANYEEVKAMTGDYSPLTVLDKLGDIAAQDEQAYQNRVQRYNDGIIDSFSKGNFSDAGAQIANSISQSIPSMIGMAITSGAANASKLGYIQKTLSNALPFASSQNENLRDENVPDYIRPISAGLNALSEVIFDQSFGTQAAIENVAKLFKYKGADAAVEAAKEMSKGYLGKAISAIGGLKSIAKGSLEEMTTTFSQNLVNKITVNPEQDLMEGVLDAGVVGGLMTGGVTIGGKVLAGRYNSNQKKELEKLSTQRSEIIDDLDKPNIPDDVKASLSDNLEVIDAKIEGITEDAEAEIESLPDDAKAAVLEGQNELLSIQNQLESDDITETTKGILQERVSELETQLNNIINNSKTREKTNNKEYDLYHTGDSGLNIESISVDPRTTRQGRKGNYGGFYTYDNIDDINKFSQGNDTKKTYGIKLNDGVKITDYSGSIERLDANKLQELRDKGIKVIRGKSLLGKTEIIVVDKSAIKSINEISNPKTQQNDVRQESNNEERRQENVDVQNVNGQQINGENVNEETFQTEEVTPTAGVVESATPVIETQTPEENATTQGNIQQDNQQQREGVVNQEQGQQENRQDQETVDQTAENQTGVSDSTNQSREIINEGTGQAESTTIDTGTTRTVQEGETNQAGDTQDLQTEDLTISEEVPTPTATKIEEIRKRRSELVKRLRAKTVASSGINPEILTDLVELGATYIEEGVVRFKDFSEKLKSDYGNNIPETQLRNIYESSAKSLGYNVRGFSKTVRSAKNLTQELKESVDKTEELYKVQDYTEVRERLSEMTEAEKALLVGNLERVTSNLTSEDNIGVLAGIELINQYNAEGRVEEAQKIIESLTKSATVAAQTLRQYGEFAKSTPNGYLQLVEKMLEKSNKKLTEVQREKILELFAIQQGLKERSEQLLEVLINDINDTNYKNYYAAAIDYEDAIRALEDYIDTIRGKSLFGTLSKILQGNLLTFKSLIINPFSNFIQALVRVSENESALVADIVLRLITGRATKSSTITKDNLRLSGRAIGTGLSRANRKLIKGTSETELSKYDAGSRLKPITSLKRLFENLKSESKRKESGYNLEQGLSDFFESTLGVPANLAFRLLPYGDDPFFEQAKTQRLVEIGKTKKNLSGEALEKFVLKPDKESLEDATDYGKEATFQEDNFLSRNINQLISSGARRIELDLGKKAAEGFKFIVRGVIPFINTPSSIAIKTVKFAVPLFPLTSMVRNSVLLTKAYKMGSEKLIDKYQRQISESFGEAVISSAVLGAAVTIVANGLVSGEAPEDEFQTKQRNFVFATQPPNTINISGLNRLLKGEDPTYKRGDRVASYLPLGLLGAQLSIVNSTMGKKLNEERKKEKILTIGGKPYYPPPAKGLEYLFNFMTNAPAALQYFFNQSFVQGTETLLSSLADGNFDFANQLVKTFTTLGIPNTVSQAFRASNDYMRNVYTDDQVDNFINILKEKTGNVEDLPIKYDMWGKPIRQTPEGENPIVYQMLDIFRSQKILGDKITFYVFDIQRKTNDDGAIPPAVRDSYKEGEFRVKLTPQQKSDLAKFIGEERRKRVERVLKTYNPRDKKVDKYIKLLQGAYSKGAEMGKSKFKRKYNIQ